MDGWKCTTKLLHWTDRRVRTVRLPFSTLKVSTQQNAWPAFPRYHMHRLQSGVSIVLPACWRGSQQCARGYVPFEKRCRRGNMQRVSTTRCCCLLGRCCFAFLRMYLIVFDLCLSATVVVVPAIHPAIDDFHGTRG